MDNLSIRITQRTAADGRAIERTIDIGSAPLAIVEGERTAAALRSAGQPAITVGARFTDNGDGTITDHRTGLMWSKDNVGDDSSNWAKADAACRELTLGGHSDWRLPTRTELLTLIDDTRHDPAIDTAAFPDCLSNWYWTATPCAWAPSCAWVVYFNDGGAGNGRRDSYLAFARAVRAVPAGQ